MHGPGFSFRLPRRPNLGTVEILGRGAQELPRGVAGHNQSDGRYITIAYAQLERNLIGERVKAGMDRAKREGKTLGRPRITENPGRSRQVAQAIQAVQSGSLSYRKAAHQYGFSVSVLQRAMRQGEHEQALCHVYTSPDT